MRMSLTLIIVLCLGGVLLVAVVNAVWAAEGRTPKPVSGNMTEAVKPAAKNEVATLARIPAMPVSEPVLTHPSTPLPVQVSDALEAGGAPIAASVQVTASASGAGRITYVQYTEIMVVQRRG